MNRPTIELFVNPAAGSQSRARTGTIRSALEALGARVLLTESRSGPLVVDARTDHACAVGGDGTLRHVVDAVRRAGRDIPISTYPAGTVNLLARECAYPRNPQAFARRVLGSEQPRHHYVARIGQVPLLVCASVGPDSDAVASLSPRLKRLIGRAAYVIAFATVLLHWRRPTITLQHDGRQTECEAAYIAKGRFFAGRWSFAPAADVSDPLLHVTIVRRATRARFLLFVWTLLRGRPVDRLADVECFACTTLTMTCDEALPLQADGDIVAFLPLSITLETDAIRFA